MTAACVQASVAARRKRVLERLATGKKFCPRCQEWKTLDEFGVRSSRAGDGLSGWCRPCKRAAARAAWQRRTDIARAEVLHGWVTKCCGGPVGDLDGWWHVWHTSRCNRATWQPWRPDAGNGRSSPGRPAA